ncbi:LOW QUALITY PROTEIN: xanthine dehydrogenase 1-like [Helicoverpa zea]|uniref:LOW QUALITY PROTEIN: xanthine dehydrogenase 1-like n=1 Tax=Helicoverpa zea TaxID=7113 RepID=UPI001F58C68E|nr:LOW QUALITY PROTEIN: xanthine dehydrogenase 1-like [Helicoverpa zea]
MDRVHFKINGVDYSVGSEVTSSTMLLDYIRESLELRGTKYMCRQASCGACVVTARRSMGSPYAVNSCILPITACHGLEITTIEEVGNRNKGYHPLQTTLAENNGSQCGYCSPGWVLSMYSLLQSKRDLTMLEIEQSLGSNICRCTGYRPILEAFKKFAKDAPKTIEIPDIEDLKLCSKSNESCNKECEDEDWCIVSKSDVNINNGIIKINLKDGRSWYKVNKVADIFSVLKTEGYDSYRLICGNTAKVIPPEDETIPYERVLIDISDTQDLTGYVMDQNLIIGAGTTLSSLLDILQMISKQEYFDYLKIFYDHILLVAHIPVRNVGSIAGNLMIKHKNNEFTSDLFLLFETIGAQLTIMSSNGLRQIVKMDQFLKLDMKAKVILNVMLPPLNNQYKLATFKVMPRSQNAHATVNAGFLFKLSPDNIVLQSRIAFSGLSPQFTRASATERFIVGKYLFRNDTLQAAIEILKTETVVTENPPEPSVNYRRQLALGLFYKGLLKLCPDSLLHPRIKSGAIKLHESRPVSDGKQIFTTNPADWPINQPMPKIEALIQCAGEAKYTDDIPTFPKEVHAAFVLSTVGKGRIVSIDPSAALNYPGVIAFYSSNDIPGMNSFTPEDDQVYQMNEEVFCSGQVKYFSQPLGLIVADTQDTANKAVNLVKVKYANVEKPVLEVKVAKKDPKRNTLYREIKAKARGQYVSKVIKGETTIKGQTYLTIETLVSVTKPTEAGLAVYSTAQWPAATQLMVSRALKIEQSKIDVHIRRIGGSYGIKISRSIQSAVASSLVAMKLNRPCRIIQRMETNTKAMGKRFPCSTDFEVGVNKSGIIQYMNYNLYEDNGYAVNENLTEFGVNVYNNCYNASTWNFKAINTITDTAKNTWFRSPGTLENIGMVELMMERISYELSLDPIQLRLANLDPQYNDLREMCQTIISSSDYVTRRTAVNKFNAENRWKKRGLRLVFLRWSHVYSRYFDVNIAVYQGDGTVAISHGGVEIGQGINTKAAQVAAYMLNIPVEKVIIKENNTITSPNAAVTGGSLTTQNITIAVKKCCESLLERLEPIRKVMNNPTWEELYVKKSYEMSVDLQVHSFVGKEDTKDYNIYGVTVAEVEIDVLTGESEILRVDILQDVGHSINPELDVGQVEGAFVMGLGYWTSENLVYDSNTSELLTDRTWNYYVPLARDIPQDFRVYLRKNPNFNKTILGSKACGEPPICMSVVIPIAIREAIVAARQECGIPSTMWFNIDGPYTTEQICLACETNTDDFKFN